MSLWVSYKKKYGEKKNIFSPLKSLKKGIGSGVGSGSISQRYGSADPDPYPQQNVMNPQHWLPEVGPTRNHNNMYGTGNYSL
jgi:hypothetical protein